MHATAGDIIDILESLFPLELAEEWDNAGLQVGNGNWPVAKVWIALDPLPDVIAAACDQGVGLLVTHHPLLFKPIRSVDTQTVVGAMIESAMVHRLCIYAAHTNLDSGHNGINDLLSKQLAIEQVRVLGARRARHGASDAAADVGDVNGFQPPIEGLGRIGELAHETTLVLLAERMKRLLKIDSIRTVGKPTLKIKTVAICSGSGGSLLPAFLASGADVYISGDLKYHDARTVENRGLGLIDIGHFASEHLMVDLMSTQLTEALEARRLEVAVEACRIESDPFHIV